MNKRIKTIRKTLGYNQKKFAEILGIAQTSVSYLEKDGATVTEQNIRSICSQFHVNEQWLRHGEGEMFIKDNRIYLDQFLLQKGIKKENLEDVIELINTYFDLDPVLRTAILEMLKNNKSKTSYANSSIIQNKINDMNVEAAEEAYIKSISNSAPKTGSTVFLIIKDNNNQKQIK